MLLIVMMSDGLYAGRRDRLNFKTGCVLSFTFYCLLVGHGFCVNVFPEKRAFFLEQSTLHRGSHTTSTFCVYTITGCMYLSCIDKPI